MVPLLWKVEHSLNAARKTSTQEGSYIIDMCIMSSTLLTVWLIEKLYYWIQGGGLNLCSPPTLPSEPQCFVTRPKHIVRFVLNCLVSKQCFSTSFKQWNLNLMDASTKKWDRQDKVIFYCNLLKNETYFFPAAR